MFAAITLARPAFADSVITVDIKAFIDGRSLLVVQDNTLTWNHLDYDPPGTWEGCDCASYVTTTLDGNPVLTMAPWYPWDQPFTLSPALPDTTMTVDLDVIQARYSLSIYQLPTQANNWALILDFNDDPPGGADWYEGKVTIDWQGSSVPEPGSLLLLCTGLGGLFLVARRGNT